VRRRSLLQWLVGMPFGFSIASAQQPTAKTPRVAVLSLADNPSDPRWEAFRRGLHDLGYAEGENITLEYRLAHGDFALLKQLTKELANQSVNAIIVDGVAGGQAAAELIRTTPIVIAALGADPIELHLADSLARPGHNVTGFTITAPELAVKRVDLLKAAFPAVTAMDVLLNPSKAGAEGLFRLTEKTAHSLGLTVERVAAVNPEALNTLSLNTLRRTGGSVLVLTDAMFWEHRREIVGLVAAARVPAMYPEREFVDDGGLMAYGPSVPDNFRRAASYIDRILKGANPAELPMQEPVKFEFIVNLKTANALGFTIPPLILDRADDVIE
jgi:putative tryptophan/tyrosine transport system substrate-binding protein